MNGPIRSTVFLLALPVLGEQLLNFLIGFFDVWLSGHLPGVTGTEGTAAVGVAAYVGWLASLIFSLVATGTTAMVSRARGSGDQALVHQVTNRSMSLAALIGLIVMVCMFPAAPYLAGGMGLEGNAFQIAVRYLRIDAVGLFFTALSMVAGAAFRGCADMRTPMLIFGAVSVLNALFSTTLVYGIGPIPSFGVDGIVLGTCIARISGGLIFLFLLRRGRSGLKLDRKEFGLRGETIQRILRIGAPAALDGVIMWSGHVLFIRAISGLGELQFAAHIVGMRVEAITYLPAVAWGAAAATMVGQSLGAGNAERAIKAGHEAALQCSLFGVGITLWFVFGAEWIYTLMHQDPAVAEVGAWPFQIVGLFQIPLILSIVYSSALRGAGDSFYPLLINTFTTYPVRLPICYYCVYVLNMGLMGAWMAMNIDMLVRGILASWRFASQKWINTKV
ncbi:MATE family efflux transporter [Planctomicrobium sp. SH668]|uniref:MATE family efflux transporter n=1 Tax=Planctomicrobium sp. SH668 TaxID=3448126 RepID=UPI003F5B8554